MEIKFFDKNNATELFLDKKSVKFFNYTYLTKVKLFKRISEQSIRWFIRHVKILKRSSTKEECNYLWQSIIKLIYLRKDLTESKFFNVPLFFSPSGECLTGDGRVLISTFYVPDITFDCVFYDKKFIGNYQLVEKLISDICKHKKYSPFDKISLCSMQSEKVDLEDEVNFVRSLEIVSSHTYHQKLFDYSQGYYLSKYNLNYNLWEKVYTIIKNYQIENIQDYVELLNIITSIPT